MKIALIGYGKMGKMVEKAAIAQGHVIVAAINSASEHRALATADVCIDFTHPDCALTHLKLAAELGKNMVMGTTGWYGSLDEARSIVEQSGIGFVYSPNFSLGVALFLQIVSAAASLIAPFETYDVSGLEIHHKHKADSPSGTAKAISEQLQKNMPLKPGPIDFASVRVGMVPGTHSVLFDSPADSITLTHTARNREGFAHGALQAAEWLQHKKGFFTLNDMIRNWNESA